MKKIKFLKKIIPLFLVSLLVFACSKSENEVMELALPVHFPPVPIPEDNALTTARIDLGRRLFFDPFLSKDSTLSCASCHFPSHAFSDTAALSIGIDGKLGKRNAPGLMNVAYIKTLHKDGGIPSLEKQVISPLENPLEMGFQLRAAAERLAENPVYQRMSQAAYDREFSPYVLVRAIAAFERTLIGGTSLYDDYLLQNEKSGILSAIEEQGRELFFSDKTNCSSCHSGVLFTNFAFENNGVHEVYEDLGRGDVSIKKADNYKFRVPSLRNVERTAPYMFDGSLPTLAAVIEHYDKGGENHYQKNPLIRPLHLTSEEKNALVAFLKTLTEQ